MSDIVERPEDVNAATSSGERTSNHDAVPEAKADGRGRDNPDTPDHVGTGNTYDNASPEAGSDGSHSEGSRVRASATPTGNTPEPVAWMAHSGDSRYVAELKEMAAAAAAEFNRDLAPLYLSPTLTDEEREAVKWCRDNITAMAHPSSAFASWSAAALRKLLERLK